MTLNEERRDILLSYKKYILINFDRKLLVKIIYSEQNSLLQTLH